jgi:N-acetylmuramoyl-L-alanine amidase
MSKSSKFADALVAALDPKIIKLPRVHRYAGFRVLKAPDVPSTLIELGFLSNLKDVKRLQSSEYRTLVTRSLVKGIDAYFAQRAR